MPGISMVTLLDSAMLNNPVNSLYLVSTASRLGAYSVGLTKKKLIK